MENGGDWKCSPFQQWLALGMEKSRHRKPHWPSATQQSRRQRRRRQMMNQLLENFLLQSTFSSFANDHKSNGNLRKRFKLYSLLVRRDEVVWEKNIYIFLKCISHKLWFFSARETQYIPNHPMSFICEIFRWCIHRSFFWTPTSHHNHWGPQYVLGQFITRILWPCSLTFVHFKRKM